MILDTLYKRTRTGAIQFWEVSIQTGDPDEDGSNHPQIVKTSGQLGTTNPLLHCEVIRKGKNIGRSNETTPLEQATSQANSDWAKKHDEGYKSLSDLGVPVPFETQVHLFNFLSTTLPEFNTDASGEVKPQLAPSKPFVKGKAKYPKQMEKKLDGNRATCLVNIIREGSQKYITAKFLSRSGKSINSLNHIVRDLLDDKLNDLEESIILDGEVYLQGLTLEEINEAIKKENDNTGKLQFWVFDLPLHGGRQEDRTSSVKHLVEAIESPFVHFEEPITVHSDLEVQQNHNIWVQDGYEGAMLKDLEGQYCPGQRNPAWTKVKMFDDNEFEIVCAKLGQRGSEDLVFTCLSTKAVTDYNPRFDVKMGGTKESKAALWERAILGELNGKFLTVKHFDYSKYGIPNLPTGKAIRDHE